MRPDGGGIARMTHGGRVDWFPHPDPRGELIAYLSYPEGTTGHPPNLPVELRLMPIAGGSPGTIASFFGGQGSINVNSWSPDGSRLAYVAYPVE
jgi:Tol biopolymer transport system component